MKIDKTMGEYSIQALSDQLYLIIWHRSPESLKIEFDFLKDLRSRLDSAEAPIYFISDLRNGRITNVQTLHQLGQMTTHPNWGGGIAFSQSPLTKVFVRTFTRLIRNPQVQDGICATPEEALAFIENLQPGITKGIDWNTVLQTTSTPRDTSP